jgi:RNA polymerase sigma factor (sigma-70 family)
MTMESENALIIGCCRGDRETQETFIRRFSNLVYSTILHTCKARSRPCDEADLDDLHNTVFMRLLEKRCRRLRQFKGRNGCSLASWVRVVTVRTVIDHLRATRDLLSRPGRMDDDGLLPRIQADIPEPWTLLDRKQQAEAVRRAMDSLLPRDRLFLKLHCMEGLALREVAGIMNVTENNAYSMKHRAINRLKAAVEAGPPK